MIDRLIMKSPGEGNDSTIVENKFNTDGVDFLLWRFLNETNVEANKTAQKKQAMINWSPTPNTLRCTYDSRKGKDLWVVNSIAEPAPRWKPINTRCPRKEGPRLPAAV